jgi:predicted Rossmann fold nucleotide-binding protein DprA/Smf involved in DNA uptake
MEVIEIGRAESGYPGSLEVVLGDDAPERLWFTGNFDLLNRPGVAFFCSQGCTGLEATLTYDIVQLFRDEGCTVAGGWQSPMEQEALNLLLKSPHPIIAGLARALPNARLPPAWKSALTTGRMLVVSACPPEGRRVTSASAAQRNLVIGALADRVFVAHLRPGGRTDRLANRLVRSGKPVFALRGAMLTAESGNRCLNLSEPNSMNEGLIRALVSGMLADGCR